MTRGDSFGSRTLIPFDVYQSLKMLYYGRDALKKHYPFGCSGKQRQKISWETNEYYWMKSLLSVQADSAKVDVWIINKNHMGYLTDRVLKDAFEKIMACKEIDRPHSEQDIQFIVE